jgi:probable phosphoglycerate mutase
MIRLVLIRHAATAWNLARRIQGRSDIALCEEGRAAAAAWTLPSPYADARLVSSPLVRAVETARLVSGREPEIEPRLAEMNWDTWEGRTLGEMRRELGEAMVENEARGLDFRPGGGESPRDVQARVAPLLAEVARDGRTTVALTHRGVIRAITAVAYNWDMTGEPPVEIAMGTAYLFDLDADGQPVRGGEPLSLLG